MRDPDLLDFQRACLLSLPVHNSQRPSRVISHAGCCRKPRALTFHHHGSLHFNPSLHVRFSVTSPRRPQICQSGQWCDTTARHLPSEPTTPSPISPTSPWPFVTATTSCPQLHRNFVRPALSQATEQTTNSPTAMAQSAHLQTPNSSFLIQFFTQIQST